MSRESLMHHVNLVIVDSSINVFHRTKFSSYKGFAGHISNSLNANRIDEQWGYLHPIIKDVEDVFGFLEDESLEYVLTFFVRRTWETHYEPVKMVRSLFGYYILKAI